MDNFKIDIVIPTYNRSGLLRNTIESVLAQSEAGYGLYVLDNCSTDDTADVCASYESKGLKYIRNQTNLGMLGNWNRALEVGASPYLLILHDDDELAPEFLAATLPMIAEAEEFSFLHSAATIIGDTRERLFDRIQGYPKKISGDDFFTRFLEGKMSVICPSVIYNRSVIPRNCKFQEELPWTADIFFFIGASEYGSVIYSDKPHFRYRQHAGSNTLSIVTAIDEKIADRARAAMYLQDQANRRDVPAELRDSAGNRYRLSALSADVWFTRRLGGNYRDVVHVARKIVEAEPKLLIHSGFYKRFLLALLPSVVLNGLATVKRRVLSARRA